MRYNLLFPPVCCGCETAYANKFNFYMNDWGFCSDCERKLKQYLAIDKLRFHRINTLQEPFFVISAFPYISPINHMIRLIKFNEAWENAEVLGRILAYNWLKLLTQMHSERFWYNQRDEYLCSKQIPNVGWREMFNYELINNDRFAFVSIPLHEKRLQKRGFNQAGELIRGMKSTFDLPDFSDILIRVKNTDPQTELSDFNCRQKNMQDAFICRSDFAVKDKLIILVDDVLTTGATILSAGKALLDAGAEDVMAMVVASNHNLILESQLRENLQIN